MALSQQDMLKGVDFTGIDPVTGADLNNGIELAAPVLDSAAEGKAIVLWTKDSALNTPIVPNAAAITKWQRYLWSRIPHSSAPNLSPLLYAWNEDTVSDATLLKWKRNESDVTALQAEVDALEVRIDNVEATANNAATVAGNAAAQAAAALAASTTANATANTANANADVALTNAATAQATATEAIGTANNALSLVNAAQTTADNALANSLPTAANKFFNNGIEYDIIDGVIADVAHGFAARPKFIDVVAICKVAELGYAIGDEVDIQYFEESNNSSCPFAVSRNATNIAVMCKAPTILRLTTKATPSIIDSPNEANWKIKIYAWA